MMWSRLKSPINGSDVQIWTDKVRVNGWQIPALDHSVDGFGLVFISEAILVAWRHGDVPRSRRDNSPLCTPQEALLLAALLRSHGWRAETELQRYLITCADDDYGRLSDAIVASDVQRYVEPRSMSQLIQDVRRLGFHERAMETLANVAELNRRSDDGVVCPYILIEGDQPVFRYRKESVSENGVTFATPDREGHFIYEYLWSEGYVSWHRQRNMKVSAKGHMALDEMRRGKSVDSRQVFVIRRWDRELDQFLRTVFEEVGRRLGLKIEAVWESEHNEKIDERILRLIRESAAVVLHVSHDKFNVGLEAGYALALGKPIVTIREKPADGLPLPFDIVTLNCYDYTVEGQAELIDKLEARLALVVPALNV